MKTCNKFLESKPITEFYKHKQMPDGYLNQCKSCVKSRVSKHRSENIDRVREYDRNRPNKEERSKANFLREKRLRDKGDENAIIRDKNRSSKYRKRNPEKYAAQTAVGNAIRYGKLIRPNHCSSCNTQCKPQGHHWSYHTDHQLDVIWLCTKCHTEEHNRLRDIGRCPDTNCV